jgi:hypothetical protein
MQTLLEALAEELPEIEDASISSPRTQDDID